VEWAEYGAWKTNGGKTLMSNPNDAKRRFTRNGRNAGKKLIMKSLRNASFMSPTKRGMITPAKIASLDARMKRRIMESVNLPGKTLIIRK
jgi:hypothetical protein